MSITINMDFKSLQDQMNALTSEKRTKQEFIKHLSELESNLSISYGADFRIKYKEMEDFLECTVLLNNFILLTFKADF